MLTNVIDAERAPAAAGLKVTPKEQLPPTAISPLQVEPTIANSAALLLPALEIVTVAPPVLDRVKVCAALVVPTALSTNTKAAGTDSAPGVATLVPVPVTAIAWGLPVPELAMVIDEDRGPAADAVNVMLKLQLAPGTTLPVQLELVIANSAALLLLTADMATAVPPVLLRLNACGGPPTPIIWVPKA